MRWDRHNQERRQQIIDAAIAVIEENEPGAEVHVQQIAERAGVGRTVVYRHFTDRADLDRAVQQDVLDGVAGALLPHVTLDGTVPDIVERIVGTYVEWAVAHPALHRLAEADGADGTGPLRLGLERISDTVVEIITTAVDGLGLELGRDHRAAIDPLVHGLVGAVFGAVRRWLARPEREPRAEVLVGLVTDSVWFIIQGHARTLGLRLDREQPVEDLLASALAGA
ncbi:TetR/AcrR family transcriptional regulator [Nocardioides sp. SYSU D00038]|uniref:TetR/AcrR family transcriptional regulator n=1 Tax=Nocardioides sp. SYSU D00038 TaxID=2812554 RepID=UPI0027DDEC12|nr:TetR/AcrR family transcriptional regulator [Nocardioides sp. SYSU D00038]